MKSLLKTTAGELVLWMIANVICVAAPALAVHLIGTSVFDMPMGMADVWAFIAGGLALTWGSWASLVWTRTRVLRTLQELTAIIPGVLVVLSGAVGIWAGFGKTIFWAIWLFSGLGVIATATLLLKRNRSQRGLRRYSIPMGLLGYPLITTLASCLVWVGFQSYVSNVDTWRDLFTTSLVFMSIGVVALTTTVIPCIVSTSLRRVSATFFGRPS